MLWGMRNSGAGRYILQDMSSDPDWARSGPRTGNTSYSAWHSTSLRLSFSICPIKTLIESCCCLVAQLYLTLCDPMDYSLPGSSVYGIFQARIMEWVTIAFSRGFSPPRDQICVSCIGRQILYHCTTWDWKIWYPLLSTCVLVHKNYLLSLKTINGSC